MRTSAQPGPKESTAAKRPAIEQANIAELETIDEGPVLQRKTCPCGGGCPRCVQAKLRVSQPGDPAELEADEVSAAVVQGRLRENGGWRPSPAAADSLQRKAYDTILRQPATEESPATPSVAPRIVDDDVEQPGPGQMRKAEFLSTLRTELCQAVDEALKGTSRSTEGCPWIERTFAFYASRSSSDIESAVRRYVSSAGSVASATGYISLIVARVARAAAVWAKTGEVTGVPEGVSLPLSEASPTAPPIEQPAAPEPVAFKTREGATAQATNTAAVRSQLGDGSPMETGVRSRMENAFGTDFSAVRIHNDPTGARLSDQLSARAFTIGGDIAFASGEYRPGTPVGDALLAHELAHVVQQGADSRLAHRPDDSALSSEQALENDANFSAAGATLSLWSKLVDGAREIGRNAMPRLRGGLRLQRCGNSTTPAPLLYVPTPVARRTAAQIFGDPAAVPPLAGMTLQQFKEYTVAQADWFVEPTLAAGTNRNDLWQLLLIAQEGAQILSGVGDVQVAQLRGVSAADWAPLRAFCRGTHGSEHTVRIFPPLPALADRISFGKTLLKLEALIPPATLETTVSQVQVEDLQANALLPLLTTYWNDYQPLLEQTFTPAPGARGPEFQRILVFLISLGALGLAPLADLRGATPNLRWVRNLHRFPLPMLLQLVANLGDKSGVKRLVLVLHSGHDSAGAFQGPNSTKLFSDLVLTSSPDNLVLMIEGPTSLADMTARVPSITNTWGQKVGGVRRISQLLIAGHGSDKTAEMAGTAVTERLVAGTPATKALLDALLKHMDPAQARILYAACEVGATDAPAGTAAAAIPGVLAAQQSLGAFTEARATAAGIPAGRVQAARASVALGSMTSLTDGAGKLAPGYAFDPNAFGSASNYAQSGHEPEGVLRAAVEVGAVNTHTAETLLRTRLTMPAVPGDWYDAITRLLVGLALPPVAGTGVNLQTVNELANAAPVVFLVRWAQFNYAAGHFVNQVNPLPSAAAIYAGIAATPSYTAPTTDDTKRMRIMVDQGWLKLVGAVQAPVFLAGILATGLPANAFETYLDLTIIGPHAAVLLPLVGPPTKEQIRLALAWLSLDGANMDVKNFLTAQVLHPAGAPAAFPPSVHTEIDHAGLTDREILDQLGFSPVAVGAAPVGGGPALPLANLALPGSATNTLVVSGRPYQATVTAAAGAPVRPEPDPASKVTTTLVTGASVRVTGSGGDWSAVDVGGQLGIVQNADISAPPL